ncbi:MAG TPA: basic secretory protein-like protein [Fimbriimonadaceae bacterium]|nr:basic secretory protein-like protein [Fimbriimonadaceae bacterium]
MISAAFLLVGQASLAKHIYPLSPALPCPPVVIDVTDFPEGQAWANEAKALVESWYGKVTQLLATAGKDPITGTKKGEPFQSPKEIRLVFKKDLNVPAHASGGTITINGKWITQRPDDLGMVVHELVHVVQQYPNSRNKPGWLVEGIADYIRWWRYEPELHAGPGRTKVDPEKAKYTDSYRTTAVWLAYCSRKYDMRLVPALDKAMRDREDPLPLFKSVTGKDADELWKEFVESLKR